MVTRQLKPIVVPFLRAAELPVAGDRPCRDDVPGDGS
jgi:hypothetical protein